MEELSETSELLGRSIDKYTHACSVVAASYKGDPSSLADKIGKELEKVSVYEKAILNAKTILLKQRNRSPAFVPINALPAEVLDWIFQLADYSWTCALRLGKVDTDDDDFHPNAMAAEAEYNMAIKLPSIMYPEALTHVCSRWRQVALSSQKLWSRIDLPIFSQSYKPLFSRGRTFASRVVPSILDVHILTANRNMLSNPMYDRLEEFCGFFGANIRSLKLTNGIKTGYTETYLKRPLQASFSRLMPGTLKHLAVIDHHPPRRAFIRSKESTKATDRHMSISISVPQKRLDEILRPIRSLWLKNNFFPWESPAYCGLVDLRLLISSLSLFPLSWIEPLELTKILSSCPRLQIFHCDLEVKTFAENAPVSPVDLADLEELNLCRINPRQHGRILSLLLPGQKPLSLSIQALENPKGIFSTAVLDFFNRSNVVALYIKRNYDRMPSLTTLLTDSPASIRILGLDGFLFNHATIDLPTPHSDKPRLNRLDCLNVKSCCIEVKAFRDINRVCPIQMLKILGEEGRDMDELAAIFPVVKCIRSSAPIEEWNSWGTQEQHWQLP